MARYAFDLDGTLNTCPELCHLARALGREGHKTIIITASDYGKKELAAKIYAMNLEWIWKIVKVKGDISGDPINTGKKKGKVANKLKVSLYFDNDAQILAGFGHTSKIPRLNLLEPSHKLPKKKDQQSKRADEIEFDGDDYLEYDSTYLACPCDTSAFVPLQRCYHCTTPLETVSQRARHAS